MVMAFVGLFMKKRQFIVWPADYTKTRRGHYG